MGDLAKKYPPICLFRWYCWGDINNEERIKKLIRFALTMLLDHGERGWFFDLLERQFKNNCEEVRFRLIRNAVYYAKEQKQYSTLLAIYKFIWTQTFYPNKFFPADYSELVIEYFGQDAYWDFLLREVERSGVALHF